MFRNDCTVANIIGRLAALVVVAALFAGCGSHRPETVPVRGRVTFNGEPPPGPGRIYFNTERREEGFPLRAALADFDAQGRFEARTWEPGDGVIPGSYRIQLECWEVPPTMQGPPAKSYLPPEYENPTTSGLTLTVEPGDEPHLLEIDVRDESG